jgi:hypothetical protein
MTAQLWVILGKQDARKGSTIRALTGAGKKRELDVALSTGEMKIHIAVMSVNEPADAPDPISWAKQINKSGGNHLVAFRTGSGRKFGNECAPEKYLKKFLEGGGVIESLVNIGGKAPNWVKDLGCEYRQVIEHGLPSNAIAHKIRQFWKWL